MSAIAIRRTMAGVGLIEVLVALMVIAGGVLALSRMQGLLMTSAASSRQLSDASFIAQREIENLRSRDWSDDSLSDTASPTASCTSVPSSTEGTSYARPDVLGATATYQVQYRVWSSGAAGSMECKTVQVTVSWTDAQAQVRTYTASTRLQRIGADLSARLLAFPP